MRWTAIGLVVSGLVVAIVLGRAQSGSHQAAIADLHRSVGSLVLVAVGLLVIAAMEVIDRRGAHRQTRTRLTLWAASVLVVAQTVFLVAVGFPLWSTGSQFFSPAPAPIAELQAKVGSSAVGLGSCIPVAGKVNLKRALQVREAGILANANAGYHVQELAVYDPIIPAAFYRLWKHLGGGAALLPFESVGWFCPSVTTLAQAQVFGVGYVLEPPGQAGPNGTKLVGQIAGENLYSVPNSGPATVVPSPVAGATAPITAVGRVVPVTHPSPSQWKVTVDSRQPALLRLRLAAVPGWHATSDGHSLKLTRWADGTMLEAKLPPGSHTVEISYRPTSFVVGAVVALVAFLSLIVFATTAWRRHRSST